MRRLARAGLAAAALAGVALGTTSAATPATAATGCDGVLVVVEGTGTGCARDPGSGLDALRQAGFAVTLGTGRYAGGFVCALDGRPAEGCAAVDADTYWSYWTMAPGTDRWVYSQAGAATSRPRPGGIEAWVWQDGGDAEEPSPRSAVAAPPPRPTPSRTTPASTPGPTATARSGPRRTAAATTSGPAGAARSSGTPGSATPGPPATAATPPPASTPAAATPTTSRTPPADALAPTAADTSDPTGPPAWTGLAGLLVAAAVGADALRRARRRGPR